MQIRDITLSDICVGKNWRLARNDQEYWLDAPLEDWGPLIETEHFTRDDRIVYSGLVAYRSGRVKAIVLIRTVSDGDYGGDYCEYVDGVWRQVGLKPNPNAEAGEEFIANPLQSDQSFCGDYNHEHQRRGFLRYVCKLKQNA
jgi:hypothetical protein